MATKHAKTPIRRDGMKHLERMNVWADRDHPGTHLVILRGSEYPPPRRDTPWIKVLAVDEEGRTSSRYLWPNQITATCTHAGRVPEPTTRDLDVLRVQRQQFWRLPNGDLALVNTKTKGLVEFIRDPLKKDTWFPRVGEDPAGLRPRQVTHHGVSPRRYAVVECAHLDAFEDCEFVANNVSTMTRRLDESDFVKPHRDVVAALKAFAQGERRRAV